VKEHFYRQIIEESPIGYAYHRILYNNDMIPYDYEFIEVNSAFEALTGLEASRIIGEKVTHVLPDIKNNTFDWIKWYGDIAINGTEKHFEQFSESLNKWFRVYAYSPEKFYFITQFVDISHEKEQIAMLENLQEMVHQTEIKSKAATDHAYEELLESKNFLETLLEFIPAPVFYKDANGRYLGFNQAFEDFFGKTKDELIGKNVFDINPEELARIYHAKDAELFEHPGTQKYETQVQDAQGTLHDVLFNKATMTDPHGKVTGLIGMVMDITERKQAENALKTSEEEYRYLFENTVEAIAVVQNNEIKMCNPMAQQISGYSEAELKATPFINLVYKEDVEAVKNIHYSRMNNEWGNLKQVFRLVRKSGEIRWVESTGIKITWKEQESILSFLMDITDRRKAEEALQSNKRQLSDIIDFLPDATLAVDKDRHIVIWNKAIEKMTGIPAAEMIGKSDYAYTVPFYGEARPQLMDLFFLDDDRIMTRYPNIAREGEVIIAEVFCPALYNNKGAWVSAKASPLHDHDGSIIGAIECIRDITDRKKVEKALQESEGKYRSLIVSSHDIIYTLTPEGVFNFVSPAWTSLLGQPVEQVVGQPFQHFVHPDDVTRCEIFMQKVIMTQQRQEGVEYRVRHMDGSWRWHTTSASPQKDETGSLVGYEGIARDITERKRLETALLEEKNLLETTLISVGDGVISTDNKGKIVFLNRVAEFLTGWTQESAKDKPVEEVFCIVNEFTQERRESIVKKVLESGNIHEIANHTALISKDGIKRPIEDSAAPIVQENGEIVGVVLVFRDFSEKKQKIDKIEYLSYHDQLTGLYNRRFFEEELKRLDIEKNLPISIIMGDVNGLKFVNDSFGHSMGDRLLKKVAKTIKRGCRANDIAARLGGDEFVIILPKTDASKAEHVVKHIKNLTDKEKVESIDISISFGYDTKNNKTEKMQEIMKNAEDYMYRHKLAESSRMRRTTVDLIIKQLYERNSREHLHSIGVSELCEKIAVEMGFNQYDISQIRLAGLMHDIGKIEIDEEILLKPQKLSNAEWEEVKRHSETGYRILSMVNELSEIADFVLEHHEKWDGTGYPRHLKGEMISLQARIIAVADAFDAMTNNKVYGVVMNAECAAGEIRKCSGTQFDPAVAKIFITKILGIEWE